MGHAWTIADREYARHEARRGRRFAFETVDPSATALVVVDMVPFFADQNPCCRAVIAPINTLAAALRAAGGVVAWVLPSPDPFDDLSVAFNGAEGAAAYRGSGGTGPPPARLCPELVPADPDLFAEKSAASAFFPGRCDLHARLAGLGIDTVIVTGTVTNVCVESTVRDARTLGYRVILVADACAARTDAEHNAALNTIYRSFGDVRPTAEVLALIGAPRLSPAVGGLSPSADEKG
ncbi:isochorismatase family cysteine hydrolase [Phenylobacterium sp.]|uniref:isochorismatase family cysteine hydrolase n=1 Tax=Phenylobacterium sp. TaxID=1871053 RepID=UPI00301C1A40